MTYGRWYEAATSDAAAQAIVTAGKRGTRVDVKSTEERLARAKILAEIRSLQDAENPQAWLSAFTCTVEERLKDLSTQFPELRSESDSHNVQPTYHALPATSVVEENHETNQTHPLSPRKAVTPAPAIPLELVRSTDRAPWVGK